MIVDNKVDEKVILKNVMYIRDKVEKDEFYIVSRDKNTAFRRKFKFIKISDYKKVLLNLNVKDYIKSSYEEEPDEHGKGSIHIFLKEDTLYNFHGEKEKVKIYIKIKIPDEEGSLPIISFHESDY